MIQFSKTVRRSFTLDVCTGMGTKRQERTPGRGRRVRTPDRALVRTLQVPGRSTPELGRYTQGPGRCTPWPGLRTPGQRGR